MRARFHVAVAFAGLDVKTEYTVDYTIDRDALTVSWTLHASPDLTVNDGVWRLERPPMARPSRTTGPSW
ncbi:MAG: hypothetical protein IPN77_10805 [Sandaracinaceae bacterium]|nr:hypothetical protein [Sandaracinaceae bacterium]